MIKLAQGRLFKWLPLLKGTDATAAENYVPDCSIQFVKDNQIRIPRMENEVARESNLLNRLAAMKRWPVNRGLAKK